MPNELMQFVTVVALVFAFAAILAMLYINQPASNGGVVVTVTPSADSTGGGLLLPFLVVLALLVVVGIALLLTGPAA